MRVFVTGASGWIGSAVVSELLRAGHQVVGLARSDASAVDVEAAGATVLRGTVDDLNVLREAAAASDAVVNLAFRNDLASSGRFADAISVDVAAIRAMGEALPSGGAIAIASGTVGLAHDGSPATERDRPAANTRAAARQPSDDAVLALAARGLRPSVVRLAPTNHGDGDHAFIPTLIAIARRHGFAGYPGDGTARWPAVHVRDTARLFRLAIEIAPAGSVLHSVAEEGVPLREIAEVIGRHLDLPTRSVPMNDVNDHFGFLGWFVTQDSPVSSAITREITAWAPTEPGVLETLDKGYYYFSTDVPGDRPDPARP